MSFKETEFPALIKYLKQFLARESDPLLLREVVHQLVKLYEDVPLYPGIVNMCLGNVVKEIRPTEIAVGQKIYIRNRDDFYFGTVVAKDAHGITLKGVKAVTSEDELEIGLKELDKVNVVNDKVLQEMWPSLVFEKEMKK